MAKFRYFELDEFLHSSVAKEKGIDNTPTFEIVEHLAELTEQILDPLRAAYGAPICVNSGFRCPKLNAAVGGVPTSAHLRGYAADLVPAHGNVDTFFTFVQMWLTKTGRRFDQLIIERAGSIKWVHFGLYNSLGQQRGQVKIMNASTIL